MPRPRRDQLKYLFRTTAKGRNYIYFRSPSDHGLIPLPADETSPEFRRSYEACLKAEQKKPRLPKPQRQRNNARVGFLEGSIGQAIDKYLDSTDFAGKKPGTRYQYRRVLDEMRNRVGAAQLNTLDVDAIDIYTEEIAQEFSDSVADRHVDMFSKLWQICKKYPEFKIKGLANPADDAEERYRVRQPAQPWTATDQAKFMATAPAHLKLAKLLLHFSAQRGGDCIRMKWQDFDGEGIWVAPEKTNANPNPLPNYHLCPAPLRDALLEAPRLADTILVNAWGKSYRQASTLSHAIRRHLITIGLAKPGQRTISMHGLRKNAASEVAALLVGTAGIKSITGHQSDSQASYYAKHADKLQMNAMVIERWNVALGSNSGELAKARRAKIRRVK